VKELPPLRVTSLLSSSVTGKIVCAYEWRVHDNESIQVDKHSLIAALCDTSTALCFCLHAHIYHCGHGYVYALFV